MKPLEDIRVIAVEQFGAGPFASLHLADLGAEVIKIEDPLTGGDVGRYIPPYQIEQDSLFFQSLNRNKLSLSLDLTNSKGRQIFHDLVKKSDVVHSNLRGDVPGRLGLLYDDLKIFNPAIVCSSLSGYGMTGPRAKHPGYDYMLQGLAGWMDLTGEPDGPPTKSGLSLVDFSGGLMAVGAILAGVHAARRDGIGMDCDLSLYDVAINMLSYPATWHLTEGFTPSRTKHSAHPSLVPFQNFRTSDGWVVVGCAKEKFWTNLTKALNRPDLAENPKFSQFADRTEHASELLEILTELFLAKLTAEWVEILVDAGVPCAPIHNVGEALRDAHTIERDLVLEIEHEHWGTIYEVASSLRVGNLDPHSHRAAPKLNADFEYIMSSVIGYDESTTKDLIESDAFGPHTAQ